MNDAGSAYLIAAYTVAALTLILYQVWLCGQLQKLRRKKKERHDSDELPAP